MQAIELTSESKQLNDVNIGAITLNPDEIKYLWAVGILNDVAYVALALQVDKQMYNSMRSIDVSAFSERWLFAGEDGVSPKILKPKQIRDAIHKLESVDYIKLEQQLSLELNY